MNYIDWLNQSLGMPGEAAALCREHCPKIAATEKYADLKRRFFAGEDTAEDVRAFAEEYGLHPYAMQLVLDELEKVLGVPAGSTTPDGLFTLNATRCLGACGLAPVIMVNDDVYGRLTPEQVAGIMEKYRN